MCIKYCLIFSSLSLLLACSEMPVSQVLQDSERLIAQDQFNQAEIKLKNGLEQSPNDKSLQLMLANNYFHQGDLENFARSSARFFSSKIDVKQLMLSPEYVQEFTSHVGIYSIIESDRTLLEQTLQTFDCESCEHALAWLVTGRLPASITKNTNDSQLFEPTNNVDVAILAYGSLAAQNSEAVSFYFAKLKDAFPKTLHFNLPLAQAYATEGKLDKAEPLIRDVLNKFDKNPFANYLLAKILLLENKIEESLKFSLKAQTYGIAVMDSALTRGIAQYKLGQMESAINSILDAHRLDKQNQYVRTLLISLYAQTGDTESALNIINQNTAVTEVELNAFISSLLKSNSIDSTATALKQLALNTQNDELNNALVQAAGNLDGLLETPNTVKGEIQNSLQVSISLYSLIANAKNKDAIALIDRALLSENISAKSKLHFANIKGALFMNEKRYDEAEALYSDLLKEHPHNRASKMFFFQKALRNLQFVEGQEIIEDTLAHQPEDLIALKLYYLILEKNNDSLDKLVTVLEGIQAKPEHAYHYDLLLAGLYLKNGEYTKASNTIKQVDVNQAKTSNQYWTIQFRLAEYPIKPEVLKTVFQDWRRNLPKSPYPYLTYSKRLIELGDISAAISVLEQGSRTLVSDPKIALMLTSFYLLDNKFDEAGKVLDFALKNSAISNAQYHYFLGETEYNKGDLGAAEHHLKEAYKLAPHENAAAFLATLLAEKGQVDESLTFLEQHNKKYPEDYRAVLAKGNILLNHTPEKAVEVYQSLVSSGQSNIEIRNNLAWALYLTKRYVPARENIEIAIKDSPTSKAALNTYSHILFALEDYDTLQQLSLIHMDDQAKLLVARSYMTQQNTDKAKGIASKIKSVNLTKPEQAELRKIKAL